MAQYPGILVFAHAAHRFAVGRNSQRHVQIAIITALGPNRRAVDLSASGGAYALEGRGNVKRTGIAQDGGRCDLAQGDSQRAGGRVVLGSGDAYAAAGGVY